MLHRTFNQMLINLITYKLLYYIFKLYKALYLRRRPFLIK